MTPMLFGYELLCFNRNHNHNTKSVDLRMVYKFSNQFSIENCKNNKTNLESKEIK